MICQLQSFKLTGNNKISNYFSLMWNLLNIHTNILRVNKFPFGCGVGAS